MAEIDSSNTCLWKTQMSIVVYTDYQPQLVVPSEVGEVRLRYRLAPTKKNMDTYKTYRKYGCLEVIDVQIDGKK